MIDLSNHAYERYAERILNIPVGEIAEYLKSPDNKENIKMDANSEFDEATFLTKAAYQTQGESAYYVYNNTVYVLNTSGQCLITLYKVDYGFGEKMDKIITHDLMEQIYHQQQLVNEIEQEVSVTQKSNIEILESVNRQIESMETQLEALKQYKQATENHNKSLTSKVILAQEKLKQLCYKIAYSTNYNLDKLSGVKQK